MLVEVTFFSGLETGAFQFDPAFHGLKAVAIQFDLAGRDDFSLHGLKAAAIQFDFSEGVSHALTLSLSHALTDRVDLSSF